MARPNPRPKVEIAFMETVTINHKPAQNRMQLPDNPLNALTHPRNPGICPACSHMKHKDVLLASACGKARKSVAPETNSIQKSHRHGGAFIRKSPMFQVDPIQILGQHTLVRFLQCRVISTEKYLPNIFQATANAWMRAVESTALKFHFTRGNF